MKITLATKITIARIFLIIPTVAAFIVAELARDQRTLYVAMLVVSAILFAICCATDFVDGHLARKTGTVSDLGKLLDPLADKVIIVVMMFLIVLFDDGLSMNGVYLHNALIIALLSGIILSRELLISVFRSIAARKGVVLAADIYGKAKTTCLDVGVTALMLAGLHPAVGWIGTIVFYIGAALAVFSGVNYIVKNKNVFDEDGAENEVNTSDCGADELEKTTQSADDGEDA